MDWQLFAEDAGTEFRHVGSARYVELYGKVPVPVIVAETTHGEYYGWLRSDRDEPSMIWRGRPRFDMCFPYGPELEQERGKGRIVRLDIRLAL